MISILDFLIQATMGYEDRPGFLAKLTLRSSRFSSGREEETCPLELESENDDDEEDVEDVTSCLPVPL